MYLNYWKFDRLPFESVPDPEFYYLSASHEEGLTRLIYAAQMRKGSAMLSGEIGCGKTTLSMVFVRELPIEKYDTGIIVNPRLESIEFLQEILYQFGIKDIPDTKVKCLRALNERMLANLEAGKETLLIVDEAQILNEASFEEIRLLLNFQLNSRFLMTIILIGQPELIKKVKEIEQLDQRIAIKYHLTPFNLEETARYIIFRQQKAGGRLNLFSDDAMERIYEHTGGVPRRINNLCDLSLLVGSGTKQENVSKKLVEKIISDGALF
ncbi:MAG: AAA family ATPase [Desulfatiglans sp.]|jgi:type II secretory pathway predicted ATPase ExeA|nr:AAA family ATPase [Desulfatiglans sp.]